MKHSIRALLTWILLCALALSLAGVAEELPVGEGSEAYGDLFITESDPGDDEPIMG